MNFSKNKILPTAAFGTVVAIGASLVAGYEMGKARSAAENDANAALKSTSDNAQHLYSRFVQTALSDDGSAKADGEATDFAACWTDRAFVKLHLENGAGAATLHNDANMARASCSVAPR